MIDPKYRSRIIALLDKNKDIGPLDDGFQHFWIKDRGALSATDLRIIADELDARNADWKAQMDVALSRDIPA